MGTAPAAIVQVDLARNRQVRRVQLSANPFEAVHGLIVYPPVPERR